MTNKIKTSLHGNRIGLDFNDDLIIKGQRAANRPDNRLVSVSTSTLTITRDLHDLKTLICDRAAGIVFTLPASSGSGAIYRFFVKTAITSNALTVKVANATDVLKGLAFGADDDAEGATGYTWKTDSGDDTFSSNGTATGGKAGDMIEVEDVVSGVYAIKAFIKQSGGSEATPFSATVS